jgi:hypothetical protein
MGAIVNRELREAERKLDELCTTIGEIEQTSGEGLQRRDVAILRSMPGIGRINLGTLLSEASGPHFARQASRERFELADDILTVFERFEVVWPLYAADVITGPSSAAASTKWSGGHE